ncbi:MAG: proline dehydrogenase family protein [Chloroflexi bacterium]|nr:proline dehydrogenase family protein [Chloroflexota bacterium]
MLRSLLISLSKAGWMKRMVMGWGIARRVARRFVAGETLVDALDAVRALNQKGMSATLDQLGEDTTTPGEARATTTQIISILDAIHKSEIRANLSLKLTQIGLALDRDLCAENLRRILTHARELGIFVRVDMEDFGCLEPTLSLYEKMQAEGFNNVGMVIQSYLYRSEADVARLLESQTRIRLVKGAYKESDQVAFPKKADADAAFDRITALLLQASATAGAPIASPDGTWPPIPAIATHDERRVQFALDLAHRLDLPKERMEFQMLYGIRRNLQEALCEQGYPVRIYVPFGTQWYPYFMRRLAERPANLWFFLSSLVRR